MLDQTKTTKIVRSRPVTEGGGDVWWKRGFDYMGVLTFSLVEVHDV
jgi:hypothetical protein